MKISISDEYLAEDIRANLDELRCITDKEIQEIVKDALQLYYEQAREIYRGEI